eukprot:166597_1
MLTDQSRSNGGNDGSRCCGILLCMILVGLILGVVHVMTSTDPKIIRELQDNVALEKAKVYHAKMIGEPQVSLPLEKANANHADQNVEQAESSEAAKAVTGDGPEEVAGAHFKGVESANAYGSESVNVDEGGSKADDVELNADDANAEQNLGPAESSKVADSVTVDGSENVAGAHFKGVESRSDHGNDAIESKADDVNESLEPSAPALPIADAAETDTLIATFPDKDGVTGPATPEITTTESLKQSADVLPIVDAAETDTPVATVTDQDVVSGPATPEITTTLSPAVPKSDPSKAVRVVTQRGGTAARQGISAKIDGDDIVLSNIPERYSMIIPINGKDVLNLKVATVNDDKYKIENKTVTIPRSKWKISQSLLGTKMLHFKLYTAASDNGYWKAVQIDT